MSCIPVGTISALQISTYCNSAKYCQMIVSIEGATAEWPFLSSLKPRSMGLSSWAANSSNLQMQAAWTLKSLSVLWESLQ